MPHYQNAKDTPVSPFNFRALSILISSALALSATSLPAWADQYPSPAKPIPLPKDDSFYVSPTADVLANLQPGELLRYREITPKSYLVFSVPAKAWQVMYRSTDSKGQPNASITTVLVPTAAPSTDRKLLSYQTAYDGLSLKCAPSYEMAKGAVLEQLLINPALKKGWVVALPDYEGLQSQWTAGVNSGQAVLDGIRAVEAFAPAGLSGAATPVAMMGYSGGSLASTWANELQSNYAPELNIRGVAVGGIPVDVGNVARKVDGKLFAGLYFGAVLGLARAFPEVNADALTNAKGKAALIKVADMCAGQELAGTSDQIVAFAYKRMADYTAVPNLLEDPQVKQIIAANRLGQRTPTAPMYIYEAKSDEVMPIADVDALVQNYCSKGIKVQYAPGAGDHITMAVTGAAKAMAYVTDRLSGATVPSNCK
jgi:hypothetical protein